MYSSLLKGPNYQSSHQEGSNINENDLRRLVVPRSG